MLGTKELDLSKTIEILKTNQALQFRVKDMASVTLDEPANVNRIRQKDTSQKESRKKGKNRYPRQSRPSPNPAADQQTTGSTSHKTCKFCGKKHEFICPAIDKECHKCKKKGHFATVCQSGKKPVHTLEEEESYSEEESRLCCQ